MALLNEEVQNQVRPILAGMQSPVKLVMFTQAAGGDELAIECTMCSETRQLAEEVAALSDQIEVEVHDFIGDKALADEYEIDKIPALAILRGGQEPEDYGIRLYGIPSGYEFSSFIHDILLVSSGAHELSPATIQELARLDRPVHIQVYVTPT